MVVVEKEKILAGNKEQFNKLLEIRFVDIDAVCDQKITQAHHVAVANAIAVDHDIDIEWQGDVYTLLISSIESQFTDQPVLFNAQIQFSIQVLESFILYSHLDKKLVKHFEKIRTSLLVHAIADPKFWFKPHPLKSCCDFLYQAGIGWQDSFGKNGELVEELFSKSIEKLVTIELMDLESFEKVHQEIKTDFSKTTSRYSKMAQRLKDSETGVLKSQVANHTLIEFLNAATHGSKLPSYIASFLQQQLADEMKLLLIKDGLESPAWLRWKKLIETLIKLYQSKAASIDDGITKNLLMQLPNEITQIIKETNPSSDEFENFINQVTYDFSQLSMGKELDGLQHVQRMEMPGLLDDIEKKVSKALIDKAKRYDEGQWFLYKNDKDERVRCQLLSRLNQFDHLLFSNFVGQKTLVASFEDFAYLLSSRKIQPIYMSSPCDRAVSQVLDKLLDGFDELCESRASEKKRIELEQQKNEEEKQRKKAAEKARVEAEEIAEREAAEKQKDMLSKIADDMKRQARLALDTLSIGAWVEIQDPKTKQFNRAKLGVKFNATQRFIFVDHDGATVAEYLRDELIDLVLIRKIKLMENDQQFADRLAKIVGTIRTAD